MSRDSIEIRVRADRVEFRDAATDAKSAGVLAGYAAVYERLSQNLGGFVEKVAHGAFAQSLADNNPVLARYNHDDNQLLGTTEAETLRVSSNETGLPYEVDLPDTSVGRDVAVLAKRGDVRYSSFAFRTLEDAWSVTDQGFPLRTLVKVQLVDVAPVNNPAYRDTSVGMRSLAGGRAVALVWRDPYPQGYEKPDNPEGATEGNYLGKGQRTWYQQDGNNTLNRVSPWYQYNVNKYDDKLESFDADPSITGSRLDGYHEHRILYFKQLGN